MLIYPLRRKGPKLYIVQKSLLLRSRFGSTRLHMDLMSAVNLMLWARCPSGEPGWAIWHIFLRECASTLRKFLLQEGYYKPEDGDPVHSQKVCMTLALLDRLEALHGVQPYIVHQRPGQAVFIPAGCTHQVRDSLF